MLHITNGDVVVERLRRTGITGDIIAWRDILHEGPTPAGLTLEGMSDVRARFLASLGLGSFPALSRQFGARDSALRSARHVVLWFEHDLYDQLQLIQILNTLSRQPGTRAELICIGRFPGIERFTGLGQLTPMQLATLWPSRTPLMLPRRKLGARAWRAFCAPDPVSLRELVRSDLAPYAFLRGALARHLEEFPAPPDGLSRTQRQILRAVHRGHQTFETIFQANQEQEEAPFLGDTVFRIRLDELIRAPKPLLTAAPITLTAAGARVLAGELDARKLNPLDRWLGGVHLVG